MTSTGIGMDEQRGDVKAGWWSRRRARSSERRAARRMRRARRQARVDDHVRHEGGEGHFKGWGGSW
jgi:hypothetical protein